PGTRRLDLTQDEAGKPLRPVSVTVQPGFTLWRIARENFGDGVLYVKVFDANKDQIRNPDLIYPGQVFLIPDQ
ncbi:LysM peptidoglycan-binding domain-containing protein, partial [Gemmobacter sp. LW-1]|uniref:LysM peptidoglycan-binding domain-containing protein n=1 Tax=Gemmobacter sp. LW-1 TaxID=1529005 RepID=UPI0006C76DBF